LDVSLNYFSNNGAIELASTLAQLPKLTELYLSVGNNVIEDSGVKAIVAEITQMRHLRNLTLALDSIEITNDTTKFIGESISRLH